MAVLPWLDEEHVIFPPPAQALAKPSGLLAAGGNLNPETLLNAYQQGIFPWYSEGEPILWWSPEPRLILEPEHIKISKSLRKSLKKNPFLVTMDRAFSAVMQHCAAPRSYTDETWITHQMFDAYCQLNRLGYAHSVECWQDGELAGGLYGVSCGRAFFGESMFSLKSNASKIALVHLCGQLQKWGYRLIDCQTESDHLFSMGAHSVSRETFTQLLKKHVMHPPDTPNTHEQWTLQWIYAESLGV